jgi:hypothetical protein
VRSNILFPQDIEPDPALITGVLPAPRPQSQIPL